MIRGRSNRLRGLARPVGILVVTLFSGTALAQVLNPVSVDSAGEQGNGSSTRPAITGDGRYVAFSSDSDNLVADDTNLFRDIFVHDRTTGQIVRVSVSTAGVEANEKSDRPTISGDGRFVAFYSDASNLINNDPNGNRDIFVHDRDPDENGIFDESNGTTTLVSIATDTQRGDDDSSRPSISADGRYVTFRTQATNLVPGDTNGFEDILVRDLITETTFRVSISSSGEQAMDGDSDRPSISDDGRFVTFYSDASNLVDGDEPPSDPLSCPGCTGVRDIFVHDLDPDENGVFDEANGITTRVSVSSAGVAADGASSRTSISGDGRYVVFKSSATNLVDGDTNGADAMYSSMTDRAVRRFASASGPTESNPTATVAFPRSRRTAGS